MLQQPLFVPESSWTMPTDFPDLRSRGAKRFSIDIESKDPNLKSQGPGFIRGDAKVIGVAVAVDGWSGYYPVAHESGPNLSKKVVSLWLNDQLKGDEPKLGANLFYDLGGLSVDMGVEVNGPIFDVQVAEPLLEEDSLDGYSLDILGKKYLGHAKDEELLKSACQVYGLGRIEKGVRKNYKNEMFRLPAKFVGPYATVDAELPLAIFDKQEPLLRSEDLIRVWNLERQITPILVKMWKHGVRVDVERAPIVAKELRKALENLQCQIKELIGWNVNVNSSEDLQRAFDDAKQYYPRTPAGNPSFTKDFLKESEFPLAKLTIEYRQIEKTVRDFIEGVIINKNVRGRIHCTWHQLRADEGGTRSGRFSCANPNLTQIPARHPVYGPLVRSLFLPDEGCEWASCDVSQQEPRIGIHYANLLKLPSASDALQAFKDNPRTDYHSLVSRITGLERKFAKEINLGIGYGLGRKKLAAKLKISEEDAISILNQYHSKFPFAKGLFDTAANLAGDRGYIKTILGRRSRFNKWEPAYKEHGSDVKPLPLHEAQQRWPNTRLKRARTQIAWNRVCQGSSSDMVKAAMLQAFSEGIQIQLCVHDELTLSFSDKRVPLRVRDILKTAIPFLTPMVIDVEVGESWGAAKLAPWAEDNT